MNSNIFNSIILSNEQVNYLMGGTAGINRLSCLFQLIQIVTRQIETANEVGESATALWQINLSEVALSKLWKCDRKTVSKMLDCMNQLGILSSVQTRRGSIHTLLCISAWIVDGKKYVNPHYIPINQRSNSNTANISSSSTSIHNKVESSTAAEQTSTDRGKIPNKEDPPINTDGTSYPQATNNFFSSLTSENGNTQEHDEEPPSPSIAEMEMEEEARRQFFKEQMEADEAPQLLILG